MGVHISYRPYIIILFYSLTYLNLFLTSLRSPWNFRFRLQYFFHSITSSLPTFSFSPLVLFLYNLLNHSSPDPSSANPFSHPSCHPPLSSSLNIPLIYAPMSPAHSHIVCIISSLPNIIPLSFRFLTSCHSFPLSITQIFRYSHPFDFFILLLYFESLIFLHLSSLSITSIPSSLILHSPSFYPPLSMSSKSIFLFSQNFFLSISHFDKLPFSQFILYLFPTSRQLAASSLIFSQIPMPSFLLCLLACPSVSLP